MTNKLARIHTAEHIMWEVLKKRFPDIKTVSLQLDPDQSRSDYHLKKDFSENDIQMINNDTNAIIKKNLTVSFENMTRQEAEKVCDLSLIPANVQQIRIVRVGNISSEACIGQHVANTSEIGLFKITKNKKVGKNVYRLYFKVI
ncbi:hypothetical protein A3F08_02265 [Candidatus Berkelbacteria bacterium RIFCSPHIGHO2_12_FULL_36_9]|uniref:Threonyl/alanyl tRNA synthetase SAD domain-containing protein n=1 Tax=Candidatus Berkelbacteria bacterium RIFCSPHIGHO2_12_FULL_36_9 TaxID=1797469 RepID=A0A1F5EFZ9_9BACT|nr:MAG: hypothetical protein A3F08_02265 [Candidatus Berkelbacteria bacterium RIFCSPHIGHO2_12_FULL_36_9]